METKQNKKPGKKAPQWIFFYYYFITLFIPNDVFALKSTFPPDINITILVLLVLLVASGKTKKTFNVWVLLSLIRVESLFFITNSQAYPAPSWVFSAPSPSPVGVSVRFAPLISHSGVSVRFKVCATGRGFFHKGHENKSSSHLSSRQSWFHCYSHVSRF